MRLLNGAAARVKRFIIIMVGFTVLLIGIAMLLLPGPAIVVIPIGLAILSAEFVWAKKLLDRVKAGVKKPAFLFREKDKTS